MRSINKREVALPLGIIVEKRKSSHPWGDWNWFPSAVFINPPQNDGWQELMRGEEFVRYHAATLFLELHRKDTEALRLNLMQSEPELYVVLQEDEEGEFPYKPHKVTASSYDAQDFHDAGDDIIEKVLMPEAVAAFIQAFVEEHHVEEEFKKRRRDRLDIDEQKFGKSPIFVDHTKH